MRVRAALLLVLLALPLAVGQAVDGDLSILVYHAGGGPEPDPWATPLAPPPREAERLPATFFDRALRASQAPENQPASAPAHYREMQRLLELHASAPSPVRITLGGRLVPGAIEIDGEAAGDVPGNVTIELVVFEHGEALYAARMTLEPLAARLPTALDHVVRLDPAWSPERLGVVAIVRDGDDVLQSATWLVRDDAPVTQSRRAVLLEHVTASWCEPCRPADEALHLLAKQRGPAGGLDAAGEPSYLRAPTWRLWLGLAVGSALGVALARRARA